MSDQSILLALLQFIEALWVQNRKMVVWNNLMSQPDVEMTQEFDTRWLAVRDALLEQGVNSPAVKSLLKDGRADFSALTEKISLKVAPDVLDRLLSAVETLTALIQSSNTEFSDIEQEAQHVEFLCGQVRGGNAFLSHQETPFPDGPVSLTFTTQVKMSREAMLAMHNNLRTVKKLSVGILLSLPEGVQKVLPYFFKWEGADGQESGNFAIGS